MFKFVFRNYFELFVLCTFVLFSFSRFILLRMYFRIQVLMLMMNKIIKNRIIRFDYQDYTCHPKYFGTNKYFVHLGFGILALYNLIVFWHFGIWKWIWVASIGSSILSLCVLSRRLVALPLICSWFVSRILPIFGFSTCGYCSDIPEKYWF